MTAARESNVHLLLTANNPSPDLCKTILTAAVLEYPTPIVLAWQQEFNEPGLLAGGSHLAKVSEVLKYLTSLPPGKDDDIVFLVDAYDVWFQLPMQVLLGRYKTMNAQADARLARRWGLEQVPEGLEQTIVMAAGKRCAPNQPHTIACYPLPEPPTSMDLYGNNTDTIIGRNKYYSLRQRYLNSGYIVGPAAHMRSLFERASILIKQSQNDDPEDNGSHGSDMLYHGSDQSIFNIIFGQQEYRREGLRRESGAQSSDTARPETSRTMLEGTVINDVLNPSFTHEIFVPDPGVNYEYHIGLDYHSDLGHQTVNSELDARYLRHDRDLPTQIDGRNDFDCPLHSPFPFPADVLASKNPYHSLGTTHELYDLGWPSVPLYSHLCYGTIPVLIHHNGDKSARGRDWDKLWLQPELPAFLAAQARLGETRSGEETKDYAASEVRRRDAGAWIGGTEFVAWDVFCPAYASQEVLPA